MSSEARKSLFKVFDEELSKGGENARPLVADVKARCGEISDINKFIGGLELIRPLQAADREKLQFVINPNNNSSQTHFSLCPLYQQHSSTPRTGETHAPDPSCAGSNRL